MNKSLLYSGVVGTIVYHLLGWLVYGILFPDLATGEESPLFIFLGCLFYAFIFAVIFTRWTNISTFSTGFNAGLIVGVLYAMSYHFFMISGSGSFDFIPFLKEIVIGGLMTAALAGATAFVIGKTS
ncbi:hypothetical protein N8147_01900 [Flavobacteriaceae bacterium]|nr:hypothetical protein [Flavobacteriaceae bacterium]